MIQSRDNLLRSHGKELEVNENEKAFQESLAPGLHDVAVPFNCSPEIIELALLKFVV